MESNTSPKKRKLCLKDEKCVFCGNGETNNQLLQCLRCDTSDALISVCKNIVADISINILSHEKDIREGVQKIFYHKLCRTRFLNSSKVDNSEESSESASKNFTRSKLSKIDFDWKNNCFICGDK